MDISIVTGTYNRLTLLQKMVASVRASIPAGITYEFVIVDGGSTDGTLDWLRRQRDVVLIEHGALLGAKKAFCDGAERARGKYVIMANDDVEFINHESIIRALVYLENTRTCGGVAFADNRRTSWNPNGDYRVNYHPATRNGQLTHVVYAQVGMFPRWLGDRCDWWGEHDPDFHSRMYGVDNYLSSKILELGYSIDPVEHVIVHDVAPNDELREINDGWPAEMNGDHPDTRDYYDRFPTGADIPDHLLIENQTFRQLRILYLPIYESGHTIQKQQKHGLRDALHNPHGAYKGALVYEWDYLASRSPENELYAILEAFQPDMMLTQFHGANIITPAILRKIRTRYGIKLIVNWNGDYWPDGLTSKPMLDLLSEIDLQLVVNASVLPTYEQHRICGAYWQIGYEEPGDHLPNMPAHDILFLGTAYTEQRKQLGIWLREHYENVGLYGDGWDNPNGNCLYDFATGKALLNKAKIVIGDNMYPDANGFVSNRLFQSLAAGGALLLHQHVPDLDTLTGITPDVHFAEWVNFDDLKTQLDRFLQDDASRRRIAEAGTTYARTHHSFAARVEELFMEIIPGGGKVIQSKVGLRYLGRYTQQFGAGQGMATGRQYVCNPPALLWVDPADVPGFLRDGLWEVMNETAQDDLVAQSV
jgi:glycosyltransferase involved in cell wall biosynthesis